MEKHQYCLPGLCGHSSDLDQTSMQKSGFRRGICVSLQTLMLYCHSGSPSMAGFHWVFSNFLEKLPV